MTCPPQLARSRAITARKRGLRQSRFVEMLAEQGRLRPERPVEEASDIIWTLCSLAAHDLLILGRSCGYDRYEAWLAAARTRQLRGGEPIPA